MTKEEVLRSIASLIRDIDKWTEKRIKASLDKDDDAYREAMYELEGLNADARQELTFLYDYIKCLWKDAQGDELPEYDKEVIVFTQDFPNDAGMMCVAIGNRPDPKGWDGKSLSTGKIEHYTPQSYGKGGWNLPNIKFWLDLDLPVEEGGSE